MAALVLSEDTGSFLTLNGPFSNEEELSIPDNEDDMNMEMYETNEDSISFSSEMMVQTQMKSMANNDVECVKNVNIMHKNETKPKTNESKKSVANKQNQSKPKKLSKAKSKTKITKLSKKKEAIWNAKYLAKKKEMELKEKKLQQEARNKLKKAGLIKSKKKQATKIPKLTKIVSKNVNKSSKSKNKNETNESKKNNSNTVTTATTKQNIIKTSPKKAMKTIKNEKKSKSINNKQQNSNTPIKAIINNNLAKMKEFVTKKQSINKSLLIRTDRNKNTILHYCAKLNAFEILNYLLESIPSVCVSLLNKQNQIGNTALFESIPYNTNEIQNNAKKTSTNMKQTSFKNSNSMANIDDEDEKKQMSNENESKMNEIEFKSDENAINNIVNKQHKCFELLLKFAMKHKKLKSNFEIKNNRSLALLHLATLSNDLKLFQTVIKHYKKLKLDLNIVTRSKKTALMIALGKQSDSIAIELLTAGASIDIKDKFGNCPKSIVFSSKQKKNGTVYNKQILELITNIEKSQNSKKKIVKNGTKQKVVSKMKSVETIKNVKKLKKPNKKQVTKLVKKSVETEEKEEKKEDTNNKNEKKKEKAEIMEKLEEKYIEDITEMDGLNHYGAIAGLSDRSKYKSYKNATCTNNNGLKKVLKEIQKTLAKNIHVGWNGSMFVRFDEDNPRFLQAILTGLLDTPYANGCFVFDIYLDGMFVCHFFVCAVL